MNIASVSNTVFQGPVGASARWIFDAYGGGPSFVLNAISAPRSAAKEFISLSLGIEKVPGAGEKLGGAIVGGCDTTTDVCDAVGGAPTVVGAQEIATKTKSTAIAFNMR
jgi:selenophosphate synthetase-related protein